MEKLQLKNGLLTTYINNFDFDNPPVDPGTLTIELYKFMLENNGIGLAANQVGLNYRVFVMYPAIVCFNPRVILYSQQYSLKEEHCLSYPGLAVKVKRASNVFTSYQNVSGEFVSRSFDGMHSHVFQHEMDHLNGKVHLDKASRANIIEARKVTIH